MYYKLMDNGELPEDAPSTKEPTAAQLKAQADATAMQGLVDQILGSSDKSKWQGSGYGSPEANARNMAEILSGIGITDVKQFGQIPKYEKLEVQTGPDGKPVYGTMGSRFTGSDNDTTESYFIPLEDQSKVVMKNGVPMLDTGATTYGNKVTGQEVPLTYSERQTGNAWGGTFAGEGNTGYRVQFDAQGNPHFYTTGASSNTLANIMQDSPLLNVVANVAAATFGGPLGTAALQAAQGKDIGDIAKAAALSYLGGQAGNAVTSGLTDAVGNTAANVLGNVVKAEVASGGKADPLQALISGGIGAGTNAVLDNVPGFDALDPNTQKAISKVVASTIASGGNLSPNALINAAITAGQSAVAQATTAPTEDQVNAGADQFFKDFAQYVPEQTNAGQFLADLMAKAPETPALNMGAVASEPTPVDNIPQDQMTPEDWAALYAQPTTNPVTGETIVGGNVSDYPVQDFGTQVEVPSDFTGAATPQFDDNGNQVIKYDDGSSITVSQSGDVVDVMPAPAGNLPGETPVAPTSAPAPKAATPAAPVQPATPAKPAAPATGSNGNLGVLLALLASGSGQPQQQAVQPNAADIKSFEQLGYGNLFGPELFAPAPALSAQKTKQYSDGGQIDDLLRLLRS